MTTQQTPLPGSTLPPLPVEQTGQPQGQLKPDIFRQRRAQLLAEQSQLLDVHRKLQLQTTMQEAQAAGLLGIAGQLPVSHEPNLTSSDAAKLIAAKLMQVPTGTRTGLMSGVKQSFVGRALGLGHLVGSELSNLAGEHQPDIKTPDYIQQEALQHVQTLQQLNQFQDSSDRLQWKSMILDAIQQGVDNHTLQDVGQLTMKYGKGFEDLLQPADVQWASDALNEALRAQKQQSQAGITAERRQQIIEQITRNRSASTYGLLLGSSRSMLQVMQSLTEPQIPQGIASQDELRQIFKDDGMSDKQVDAQLLAETQRLDQAFAAASANRAAVKAGIQQMSVEELTANLKSGLISQLLNQPMSELMLPMDWWRKEISQTFGSAPFMWGLAAPDTSEPGGKVILGKTIRPGVFSRVALDVFSFGLLEIAPSSEEYASWYAAHNKALQDGFSQWEALQQAFVNADVSGFKKFMYEVMFDPMTYPGFGATSKVLKPIPLIGPQLAGLNDAWIAGNDLFWLGLKRGIYNMTPKTQAMRLARASSIMTEEMAQALTAHFQADKVLNPVGRTVAWSKLRLSTVKGYILQDIEIGSKNAGDTFNAANNVGKFWRARSPVTAEQLTEWLGRMDEALGIKSNVEVTPNILEKAESIVGSTKGLGGEEWTTREAASQIIDSMHLLQESSGARLNTLEHILDTEVTAITEAAKARVESASSLQSLKRAGTDHMMQVLRDTEASKATPITRQIVQAGAWASWAPSHMVAIWQGHIQKWSYGAARMYLLYGFYSPMNVLENAGKMVNMSLWPTFDGNASKQYTWRTAGLLNINQDFVEAAGFTNELGPLVGSKALRPRPEGLSINTYKRYLKEQKTIWTALHDALEDKLIKSGGRISVQQMATANNSLQTRWFHDMHPEIMQGIENAAVDNIHLLESAGWPEESLRQIAALTQLKATVHPNEVLSLATEYTPKRVSAAKQVKIINKYEDIGSWNHNYLVQKAQDGTLIPTLSYTLDTELPQFMLHQVMNSPDLVRKQLTKLVDELIAQPPQSWPELQNRIQHLLFMGHDLTQVISAQTKATREFAKDILSLDLKGQVYKEMWDELLIPFMRDSESKMKQYVTQLKQSLAAIKSPALTEARRAQVDSMLNKWLEYVSLIRVTREKQHAIEAALLTEKDSIIADIRASGGKVNADNPRIRDWWLKFHSQREALWDTQNQLMAESLSKNLEEAASINSNILRPAGLQSITGDPTPSDIAKMFGSIPEDLTRAFYVPELGVLVDKTAWIERIWAKVNSLTRGQSPEDLGWTREGISRAYDRIVADLYGSADVQSLLAPKLKQLTGLKGDLLAYAQSKNSLFTAEQTAALEQYGKAVYASLEKNPWTKHLWMNEPDKFVLDTERKVARQVEPGSAFINHLVGNNPDITGEYPLPVLASIKPKPFGSQNDAANFISKYKSWEELNSALKAAGFDGVSYTDEGGLQVLGTVIVREAKNHLSDSKLGLPKIIDMENLLDLSKLAKSGKQHPLVVEALDRWPDIPINDRVASPEAITPEAMLFLEDLAMKSGAMPGFVSKNLESIAKENGIDVIGSTTPQDIINALKTKAGWRDTPQFSDMVGRYASSKYKMGVDWPLRDIIGRLAELPEASVYRQGLKDTLKSIYGDKITIFRGVTQFPELTDEARIMLKDLKAGTLKVPKTLFEPVTDSGQSLADLAVDHDIHPTDTITPQDVIDKLREIEGGSGTVIGSLSEPGPAKYLAVSSKYSKAALFGNYVETGEVNVGDVLAIGYMPEDELIVKASDFKPIKEHLERPGISWQRERQAALDYANQQMELNFPDYSLNNMTMVNQVGKAIFPFWTYETHRAFWLPKTFVSRPGSLPTLAKYQDYTDGGYIHIPHTSWEINPLRGTIWMGGLRRLTQRNYPEFYDQVPQLSNTIDWIGRYGFYPNIFVSGLLTGLGAVTGKTQLGELVPGIIQTPLEAYVAAFPQSTAAKKLLNSLLSDRFRDLLVAQEVSKAGGSGPAIKDKIYSNTPLTPEEQLQWNNASRNVAEFNLLNIHAALFRMKPEERTAFEEQAKKVIAECTGVSVETQNELAKQGQILGNVMQVHPECEDLVRQLSGFTQWRGLASHLRGSEIGQALATYKVFWNEIEQEVQKVKGDQGLIDHQWRQGLINRDRWEQKTKELNSEVADLITQKQADPRFQMQLNGKTRPVPVTLADRIQMSKDMGFDPLMMHPEDELVGLYFGITLHDTVDPETGQIVTDWQRFFAERNAVEQTPFGADAVRFQQRIHKNDTDLEKLRRQDYTAYVKPYQDTYEFVLKTLPPEEQALIRKYQLTDDIDARQAMLQQTRPDGTNIISSFQSELSRFRTRLRQLDPELDARLALWTGRVPVTDAARAIWRRLRLQYGFKQQEEPTG